jgi:hypothetical protein
VRQPPPIAAAARRGIIKSGYKVKIYGSAQDADADAALEALQNWFLAKCRPKPAEEGPCVCLEFRPGSGGALLEEFILIFYVIIHSVHKFYDTSESC